MNIKLQSWGEVTDEIRHEAPTVEYATELSIKEAIKKALRRPHLHSKDFYLHQMLRINMNPQAVSYDMPMIVVPVVVNGKTLYATCIFRQSLPTPDYEESVFKYHHKTGEHEFLWTIPVKGMHEEYVRNYAEYMKDPDKRRQAKTCMEFHTGVLEEWIKKQNKEDQKHQGLFLKFNQPQAKAIIQ